MGRTTQDPKHPFPVVGLLSKRDDPRVAEVLAQVCSRLRQLGRRVLVGSDSAALLPGAAVEIADRPTMASSCDLVVVVGGDGTLLDAARSFAPAGVPILGVNQGRLGFMVDVAPSDIAETFAQVFSGNYVMDRRMMLEATIQRISPPEDQGPYLAINDAVLRNLGSIRMIEFETSVDGAIISQHRADGMIISTPTGSTGYALSGGGPVLHPDLRAFALVPICPHTLSDRPIVLGSESQIRMRVVGPRTGVAVTFDGQISEPMMPGDEVIFRRSTSEMHLIHPAGYDYFRILRDKLNWGHDPAGAILRG